MKFKSAFRNKLIYVFGIDDVPHKECLKVGEATALIENIIDFQSNSTTLNSAAKQRINSYTTTAAIAYDLWHTEIAQYTSNNEIHTFRDFDVRSVLYRSGIKKKIFNIEKKANEWVLTDLETVKKAITAVKEGKASLNSNEISKGQNPISFRPEQKDAIEKTGKQFKKSNEMLWFAKMRFGKTLSALQVVREHNFKKTLILTHRPVVDSGWFEDFGKIFYDRKNYIYGSKNQGENFSKLEKRSKKEDIHFVYFASMQDLRGSELVGGNFNKNDELFSTTWDFIIVDEAHEGTQTELGKNVLRGLKQENTKVLHLSGTPFNLIDDYKEEEIFTWDYVMEQKAKTEWDSIHFGDPNPYASLPKMNIFTYDLGKLLKEFSDAEIAFNFREFFRVNDASEFIHKKDVVSFLNLISKKDPDSNYPFSTDEYRENFRHSLWMVPGVKEAKALSILLQAHPVFSHFNIVNVAGDGDDESGNEEALRQVEKAITNKPHDTYSITLSCGRLTTGVSVPAWTAVFMLSGSYNTSASSYMQTIFRVQTPATIDGKVKEECFVFDFAPDRTLKVIAEAAKMSAKAGKTTDQDRIVMGEFLNFCPIISADGTKMIPYNVNSMLEQLKKLYIERVVNNGFEDSHLYDNDQLMKLDIDDLEEFDGLKKIIGSTKAMAKSSDINVNDQGFTDEQFEDLERVQKKKKEDLTEEEQKLLDERKEKKKNRDSAVSILRGISIRMPLLIYGADIRDEDKELNIDNFADLVDDKSWLEFMPKGVTKSTFQKFKKYYEPDVFRAAGKRIRALARATDSVTIDERIERITAIFGKFKNPDKETVLTPWRVVNMHMGDCLGGYVFYDEKFENKIPTPRFVNQKKVTDEVFHTESLILEINSKSGMYPLFVAYSIYRKAIAEKFENKEYNEITIEEQQKIWDEVVGINIFVLCKTPMAKSITKRTLVGFRNVDVNTRYIEDLENQILNEQSNFIEKISQGKSYWKTNKNDNMKFNAIVGNPPYQITAVGTNRSPPVYNKFVEIAKNLDPFYISLITPSRWMAGGLGLSDFRKSMLKDNQMKELFIYPDSNEVFNGVEVKGGISYFLWKENYEGKCDITTKIDNYIFGPDERILDEFDILVRYTNGVKILKKILKFQEISITNILSVDKEFGWTSNFNQFSKTKVKGFIPLHYISKTKRYIGWIDRKEILKSENLVDTFKVLIPKAGSDGGKTIPDIVLGKPLITSNPSVCTQSFLFFYLKTQNETISLEKYLQSKFFRFLVSLRKITQDATKSTYEWVPIQNFSNTSDIDWEKTIEEIDQQLYRKYKLTSEEIDFIEKMIKPMA